MDNPNKKVKVYSLSSCITCKKVKQFLDDHAVKYEHIEVDLLDSGEQWLMSKEVKKYNPLATYPTIVIEEVFTGFDEERLKNTLGIK